MKFILAYNNGADKIYFCYQHEKIILFNTVDEATAFAQEFINRATPHLLMSGLMMVVPQLGNNISLEKIDDLSTVSWKHVPFEDIKHLK